jgi:hypothetical protein
MADLVGDHISAGELAGRAEALGEILEEGAVEIDALVPRAIEGPHRGAGHSARRFHAAAEEHEPRGLVLAAHIAEELGPGVFGVAQHSRHELLGLVAGALGRGGRRGRAGPGRGRHPAVLHRDDDVEGIEAQEKADGDHRDQPEPAELEARAAEAARRTRALAILDVAAASHVTPAHGEGSFST